MEAEFERILSEIREAEAHAATERSRNDQVRTCWQSLRRSIEDEVGGLRQLAERIVRTRAELREATKRAAASAAAASLAAVGAAGANAAWRCHVEDDNDEDADETRKERAAPVSDDNQSASSAALSSLLHCNKQVCQLIDRLIEDGETIELDSARDSAQFELARSALETAQLEEARLEAGLSDYWQQRARLQAARTGCAEALDQLTQLELRLENHAAAVTDANL